MTPEQLKSITAKGFNRVAIKKNILLDFETPLSVYLKLANKAYTYLFESVEKGKHWGRYSFIGLDCKEIIKFYDHDFTHEIEGKIISKKQVESPLEEIKSFISKFKVFESKPEPNCMFNGGLVGYFGYDTIRYIEKKLKNSTPKDELKVPDILFMVSDNFIVFDNLSGIASIVTYINPSHQDALQEAEKKINYWFTQLKNSSNINIDKNLINNSQKYKTNISDEVKYGTSKNKYKEHVNKIKSYIEDGDVMQVVLSHRMNSNYTGPPINVYRALRRLNPSPYMYYLNLDDFHIAGSSPEILVRLKDEKATVRPLAGTRPRGKNPIEDKLLENDLLSDHKELAEHLMLIDLGRNDIGKIAKTGSVKLTKKMTIERFSHVMHISSNIEALIEKNLNCIDALAAILPAGTLSGAPKVHAMKIIDDLEPVKRNIYGGAIGYLSWNKNMDMAIALRTAIIKNNTLYCQAGAGIVYDSNPDNEWQETLNKSKAIFNALKMAQSIF